jgi:autotransporter-associated beta strand protein
MKSKNLRAMASAIICISFPGIAHATTYTKSDNTSALDLGASWGGTAPGAADVANWAGTYNTAGSLSALLPGTALTWQGITAGALTGTAAGTIAIGGTGAPVAASALTVGSGGINLTGASHDLVINAATFAVSGSQAWTIPAGRNLRFGANVATANVDGAGGNATVVTVTGGGTVDANQGAANGFADYTGKWVIGPDTLLRGIGTGTAAWGTNTSADAITLNGGTLAVGAISGTAGTISWPNPLTLGAATTSRISRQYSGTDIPDLTLAGPIGGAGNLAIDKLTGTFFNLRLDRVDNSYTGTTSITNTGTTGALTVAAHLGDAAGSKTPFGSGPINVTGTTGATAALEFTTNAVSAASNSESIIANPISLDTATLRTREGLLRLDGAITLTGANVIQGQVDLKDITINGLIDGTGSVNFRAIGTQKIRLPGPNTYSGGTILGSNSASVGVVVLGDAGALGTGTITARGMQIWSDVDNLVLANNILVGSGQTGGLCFGGTRNLSLTGTITHTDNTNRQFQNSGTGMVTLSGISMTGSSSAIARFNEASSTQGAFTVAGPITGLGQVQIRGGVVDLAGANTYTGNTTVSNAGRLKLTGSLTSNITMSAATAAMMGNGSTTGNLTVSAGTIYLDPADPAGAITAANVSITGAAKVELLSQQPLGTTLYTVLKYTGTFSGLANLSSSLARGTFAEDPVGKQITFTATTATRTWNGTAGTVWNTSSLNWNEGDQKFFAGDAAVFGDTGAGSLTISGVVSPSSATFANSTGSDYTLTATANNQLGGPGSLVKSGTGSLTLVGPNTFTGKTTVTGGTLVIRADAALGTPPAAPVADQLTLAGGTLQLAPDPVGAITLHANRGVTVAAGVSTLDTTAVGNSATATIAGETAGDGELVILANGDTSLTGGGVPGSTHLAGTSLRTGSTTIKSGVVAIESGFGDPAAVVVLDGGGLVDRSINVNFAQPLLVGPAGGILRTYGAASTIFSGTIGNAPGVASAALTHTDGGTQTFTGDGSGFQGTYTNAYGDANFDSENWAGMNLVNTDGGIVRFRSGSLTRVRSLTTDRDVHIEAGTTLDVVSGMVTVAPGIASQNFWIQNAGSLTSSSGTLTFDFQTPYTAAGADDQAVRVVILDSDTTPVTVIKNGPGSINSFDQPNAYSGGTIINAGRIVANNALALGTGAVTIKPGGQLLLAAGSYYNDALIEGTGPTEPAGNLGALRFGNTSILNGTITVAAAGARAVAYQATTTGTIDGTLTGTGPLEINSATAGHSGTVVLLADASGYTAPISVAQGTLDLATTTGGNVSLAAGSTLAGEGTVNGTLKFANSTLRVNGITPEALTVNQLESGTGVQVQLASLPDPLEPITLVNYTTLAGTLADFKNSAASLRRLAFSDTGTSIVGTVETGTRTWTGAASGVWDSAALNWVEGDQRFFTGDAVVFTDAGVAKTVTIPASVNPATVTVTNSTGNDYTLTGQMVVPAGGNLVKTGSGNLTLAGTPSNIGGELQIGGGRVTFATTDYARTVGAACTGIVVNNGGVLRINTTNPLYDGAGGTPVTINAGGVVELNAYHSHFKELYLNGGTVLGIRPDGTDSRYANEYSTFDNTVVVGGTQMSTITRAAGTNGLFSVTATAPFEVADATAGTDLLVSAPLTGIDLVKNGVGTMALHIACVYSGTTTVNGGTLLANNTTGSATGSGAVTVKTGATFGGTGLVSGAVTVESGGTLAPGAPIESLGTGALTLLAGSTLAAEINSSAGTADVANVTGNVSLAGTLTLTDTAGTPVVIPGGTKLTLLTYTGTLTGAFAGLAEDSTFAVGVNSFKIRYDDGKKVTLESMASSASDYDTWAALYAPLGLPTADDDKDGLTNQTEHAFGLHPKNGASVRIITAPPGKATGMFTYVRRNPSLTGLTYKVWRSTNLVAWTEDSTATQTPVDNGDNQTVTVTLSGPKPLTAPATYVRISAEE